MAIEKSILQAPQGMMDEMMPDEEMLEIEIVDPEEVTLSDGSVEITLVSGDDIESKFEEYLGKEMENKVHWE